MLGWTRQEADGALTFWFQCDHWGWDDAFGSRFTLEFQLSSEARPAAGGFRQRMRFASLLNNEERESVRILNNGVKNSLPEPPPTHPIWFIKEHLRDALRATYAITAEPYRSNDDVWLNYFTETDVATWGVFFQERVLRMANDAVRAIRAGHGA